MSFQVEGAGVKPNRSFKPSPIHTISLAGASRLRGDVLNYNCRDESSTAADYFVS